MNNQNCDGFCSRLKALATGSSRLFMAASGRVEGCDDSETKILFSLGSDGYATEVELIAYKKRERKISMKKGLKELFLEEDGIGTVEMILILVVLIAVVAIFKTQLTKLVGELFTKLSENAKAI